MKLNLYADGGFWWRGLTCFGISALLALCSLGVKADLVGRWRLDGDCLDSSSYAQHGRLIGEAVFDSDVPVAIGGGQSLRLSGDGFVRIEHASHLSLSSSLSIAVWVKPIAGKGWDGILSKAPKWGNWAGASGNYELRIENETRNLNFLHQLIVSNESLFYEGEASVIPNDVWSHVVLTAGVREGFVEVRYYINGNLTESLKGEIDGEGLPTNENPLYIGSRPDFRTGFDGLLDDMQLFSHELSVSDIELLASSGGGPELATELLVDLDEDALPDWWEKQFTDELGRLSGLAMHDADQDGLPDQSEFQFAITRFPTLNPLNRDSDGDGLSDGVELQGDDNYPITNPLNVDTDSDGLSDFVERKVESFSSLLSSGTLSTATDSDSDGWDDRLELVRQSHPGDPNSLPRRGLLGLWRFNDDTARDSSLFQNHGDLSNGSYSMDSPTEKIEDHSLSLSGNGVVRVPHDRSLNVIDEITVAAWVKPSGAEGWDSILIKGPSDGSGFNHAGNYEFRIEASTRFLGLFHQQGWFEDTSPLPALKPAISSHQWTHVAITASTEGSGIVHYYVNGELVDVYPESILVDSFPVNSNDLLIGNRADFFTGYNGLLDDVALFDRVLSGGEIATIMVGDYESIDLYPETPINALAIEPVSQSSDLLLRWQSEATVQLVLEVSHNLKDWMPMKFFDGAGEQREYRIPGQLINDSQMYFRMFAR